MATGSSPTLALAIGALAVALIGLLDGRLAPNPAHAQFGGCVGVAGSPAPVLRAAYKRTEAGEVRLTFVGHSTWLIESPEGVRIATDYTGHHGRGRLPDIVTMNRAHSTHYTDHPDPKIPHVLRGWDFSAGFAAHDLRFKDVHTRSVPTNIRAGDELGTLPFANSIFVFEVAGLCIGHLGHLQHELTMQQLGQIGQLDIAMVPVDGVYTMDHGGVLAVLRQLKPRVVLPMHYFSNNTLRRFIAAAEGQFQAVYQREDTAVFQRGNLPAKPQILVVPFTWSGPEFYDD